MNLFKRSRTFVTLIVATVFVAGECFLYAPFSSEKDRFWREKRYGEGRYDVLLMGDSRTNEGVSPEILQKYIPNMSFYNFGFNKLSNMVSQCSSVP